MVSSTVFHVGDVYLSPPWQAALERMFRRRQNRLYMPTVILSVIHLIDLGRVTGREVLFTDIEPVFDRLGGAELREKAWQPFFHLSRSAGIWEMHKGQTKASFAGLTAKRPKSRGALIKRSDRAQVKATYLPGLLDPTHRRSIAWEILQQLLLDDEPLPRQLARLDGVPVGRPYQPQSPPQFVEQSHTRTYSTAPIQQASEHHHALQEQLARFLHQHHLQPLAPMSCDPAFDLAWQVGDQLHVAEVKSLTRANESEQLRKGLGQVLEYRHLLARRTVVRPRALLVVEQKPRQLHWPGVCDDVGVLLVWPGRLEKLVQSGR